ncbi:MAG: right-handed parallel beta-helix repeat-containing protein [Deltaproteobacteria bacterium]|nr:right-handed parallel beta-helix repeat-containing protein [Deltaproteobacteria bacterium]
MRTKVLGLAMLVAVGLVASSALADPSVCASRTTPTTCGGASPCCCGDSVTSNYTLPDDLNCSSKPIGQHGLRVVNPGIVLDGGGHTIFGPTATFDNNADDEVGIKVESTATGAVVQNIKVKGGNIGLTNATTTGTWKRCIEVKADDVRIGQAGTWVEVESCGRCGKPGSYGVDVSAKSVTVKRTKVRYVGDEGIHVGEQANDARIVDNQLYLNDMSVDGSGNPTACREGLEAIYVLKNSRAVVARNETHDAKGWSLHMKDAERARVEDNDFQTRGITLRGAAENNLLLDNTVSRRIQIEYRDPDTGELGGPFFPSNNEIIGGQIDGEDISDHCIVFEDTWNNRAQQVNLINCAQPVRTIATIARGRGIYGHEETYNTNALAAVTVEGNPLVINNPDLGGDDVEFEPGTIILLETPGTPVADQLPSADGYVWSGSSAASVFSSEATTVAQYTAGCSGHERISLFKFALPANTTGAIDATLKLMSPLDMSAAHGGLLYAVDPAMNSIAESGMSWNAYSTASGGNVNLALQQGTVLPLEPGAVAETYTSYRVSRFFQVQPGSPASVLFSISGDTASQFLAKYYTKETSGKQPTLSYTPVTSVIKKRDQVPPLHLDCTASVGCNPSKEAYVTDEKPNESDGDKGWMTITPNDDGHVVESYVTFDVSALANDATYQRAYLRVHTRLASQCTDMNSSTPCYDPNTGFGPKVYILNSWTTSASTGDDAWQQGTGDSDVTDSTPHPDWIHWTNRPTWNRYAGQLVRESGGDGFWWTVDLSHALADELKTTGTHGNKILTLVLRGADNKLVRFDGMRNNDVDGNNRPVLVLGASGTPLGSWPP